MEALHFANWPPIRDALDSAYNRLGLTKVKTENGEAFLEEHWNIAGLVYEAAAEDYRRLLGSCVQCKTRLNYATVIRCLDCKATLCEYCAPAHFGPNHASRAQTAHR